MNKRSKFRRLVYWIIACFLLFFLIPYGNEPAKVKAIFSVGPVQGNSPFITTFPRTNKSTVEKDAEGRRRPRVKTILLWTPHFGNMDWATRPETFQICTVKACRITADRKDLHIADALIMNIRDFSSRSDLPPDHPAHQVWIAHGSEPPYYIYLNVNNLNNVFNWTSWYRSDADIFSPYGFYDAIPPKTGEGDQFQHPLPAMFQTSDIAPEMPRPPLDVVADPFSLHDRMIFWAASSCINYSQRYKLFAEIEKRLPVDSYGFCGRMKCDRNSAKCESTLKRYKFVLAFENGYCRDYVTEKYWNALNRHQIPIVSGGADYAEFAIPGSYIDVDNFTSVEELVKFVQRVGSDRELYNSFFRWQLRYRRVDVGVSNWCQICKALHDKNRAPQTYSNFKGWVAQDSCPLSSVFQPIWWSKLYVVFKLFGI